MHIVLFTFSCKLWGRIWQNSINKNDELCKILKSPPQKKSDSHIVLSNLPWIQNRTFCLQTWSPQLYCKVHDTASLPKWQLGSEVPALLLCAPRSCLWQSGIWRHTSRPNGARRACAKLRLRTRELLARKGESALTTWVVIVWIAIGQYRVPPPLAWAEEGGIPRIYQWLGWPHINLSIPNLKQLIIGS